MYKKLKDAAKDEKYYEGAEKEFDQLFARIEPKKNQDLMKFKKQITEYLESEIVSRYYYQDGRLKASLPQDPVTKRALQVFSSNYSTLITGPLSGKK